MERRSRRLVVPRALLIGINYVGQDCELKGCVNDVKRMYDFCAEKKYTIGVLFDGQWDGALPPTPGCADNTATKANILTAMHWLVANATSDSKLLIHYSGHGGLTADLNNDESSHKDSTICPADGGIIIDDELRAILVDPLPAKCSLRAIFDCCHSGTALDLKYTLHSSFKRKRGARQMVVFGGTQHRSTPGAACDVLMISGCMDSQTSADAQFQGNASGALTHTLLDILFKNKRTAAAPVGTLLKELLKSLKRGGFSQKPQISSDAPIDGQIIFEI